MIQTANELKLAVVAKWERQHSAKEAPTGPSFLLCGGSDCAPSIPAPCDLKFLSGTKVVEFDFHREFNGKGQKAHKLLRSLIAQLENLNRDFDGNGGDVKVVQYAQLVTDENDSLLSRKQPENQDGRAGVGVTGKGKGKVRSGN